MAFINPSDETSLYFSSSKWRGNPVKPKLNSKFNDFEYHRNQKYARNMSGSRLYASSLPALNQVSTTIISNLPPSSLLQTQIGISSDSSVGDLVGLGGISIFIVILGFFGFAQLLNKNGFDNFDDNDSSTLTPVATDNSNELEETTKVSKENVIISKEADPNKEIDEVTEKDLIHAATAATTEESITSNVDSNVTDNNEVDVTSEKEIISELEPEKKEQEVISEVIQIAELSEFEAEEEQKQQASAKKRQDEIDALRQYILNQEKEKRKQMLSNKEEDEAETDDGEETTVDNDNSDQPTSTNSIATTTTVILEESAKEKSTKEESTSEPSALQLSDENKNEKKNTPFFKRKSILLAALLIAIGKRVVPYILMKTILKK